MLRRPVVAVLFLPMISWFNLTAQAPARRPASMFVPTHLSLYKISPTDLIIIPYHTEVKLGGRDAARVNAVKFFIRQPSQGAPTNAAQSSVTVGGKTIVVPYEVAVAIDHVQHPDAIFGRLGATQTDPAIDPNFSPTTCVTGSLTPNRAGQAIVTLAQSSGTGCDYQSVFSMAVYDSATFLGSFSIARETAVQVTSVSASIRECDGGQITVNGSGLGLIDRTDVHRQDGTLVSDIRVWTDRFATNSSQRNLPVTAPCWTAGTYQLWLSSSRSLYARVYQQSGPLAKVTITCDPLNRCGAGESVGCSVPWYVNVVDPTTLLFAQKVFNSACIFHDYCYRHGQATYGRAKSDCDVKFLDKMRAICSAPNLGNIAGAFLSGLGSVAACLAYAQTFYEGVAHAPQAAASFRTQATDPKSTFCRYVE